MNVWQRSDGRGVGDQDEKRLKCFPPPLEISCGPTIHQPNQSAVFFGTFESGETNYGCWIGLKFSHVEMTTCPKRVYIFSFLWRIKPQACLSLGSSIWISSDLVPSFVPSFALCSSLWFRSSLFLSLSLSLFLFSVSLVRSFVRSFIQPLLAAWKLNTELDGQKRRSDNVFGTRSLGGNWASDESDDGPGWKRSTMFSSSIELELWNTLELLQTETLFRWIYSERTETSRKLHSNRGEMSETQLIWKWFIDVGSAEIWSSSRWDPYWIELGLSSVYNRGACQRTRLSDNTH